MSVRHDLTCEFRHRVSGTLHNRVLMLQAAFISLEVQFEPPLAGSSIS
jgi:hypothetical protein